MRGRAPQRRRMKRRARYVRLIRNAGLVTAAVAALAGAVFAGMMVSETPALRISHIFVSGCGPGIAEGVLAHAESYRSLNILGADLRELRSRIESDPWIERAVIRKMLPDTLAVTVSVRKPRAVVMLEDPYLMDDRGNLFVRATGHRTDLPVVCGLERRDFENDSAAAARLLRGGVHIIECLQAQALPLDDRVRIRCTAERGYTLQMESCGPEIHLGFDHFQRKISALPRMLADLCSRGLSARSIHLHSHERAYVQLTDQDGHHQQAHAGSEPDCARSS